MAKSLPCLWSSTAQLSTLLLGCTTQACKPCGCPALRLRSPETATETSTVYRKIPYPSRKQKVLERHPTVLRLSTSRTWQSSPLRGDGGYNLEGELMSGWLISYHGNQDWGMNLTAPQVNDHHEGRCFPLIDQQVEPFWPKD